MANRQDVTPYQGYDGVRPTKRHRRGYATREQEAELQPGRIQDFICKVYPLAIKGQYDPHLQIHDPQLHTSTQL
jgi:hypothetical protein